MNDCNGVKELNARIGVSGGVVVLEFLTPIRHIGLRPRDAEILAVELLEAAIKTRESEDQKTAATLDAVEDDSKQHDSKQHDS